MWVQSNCDAAVGAYVMDMLKWPSTTFAEFTQQKYKLNVSCQNTYPHIFIEAHIFK